MKNFTGIITALATPFINGKLDKDSFVKLLRFQLTEGADGFVVNGTTGESPCLSEAEVEQLFSWTKELSKEMSLILGVGTNSTIKTLQNIQRAGRLKPDAILVVVPYYNKPPQSGLVYHFKKCADASSIPLILYNVPSRTGVGLSLHSVVELSRHPNVIGIKEASGDLNFGRDIIQQTEDDFLILSGDDMTCLDLCALGAQGGICVISHIMMKTFRQFFQQVKQNNSAAANKYKEKYKELLQIVYSESNPIGIKMALYLMGIFKSPEMRSPLVSLVENHTQKLKDVLKNLKLIEASQIV